MTDTQSSLQPLDDGVWIASMPIGIVGMKMTATMTVLRLREDRLLVYSPIRMTPELQKEVDALGQVSHLFAPNLFHHLSLGDWSQAYPSARIHAPEGLGKKRRDLEIHRIHNSTPEPDFEGMVEEYPIAGFNLAECALLYRPTGTLLVADLVHNVGTPSHGWTRFYTKLMGFYDKVAISRMIRFGFTKRSAARESVDAILAQDFDKLTVGHGAPMASGAKEALRQAYLWLK